MSYSFIVIADPEEGYELLPDSIAYAYNEAQVEEAIRKVSSKYNQATICVYTLHSLAKVKTKPTYQRYTVQNGEIIPV